METPELLTLEDAAERLPGPITVRTLRGLIKSGRLPRRPIGARLYLTPADLWSLVQCPAPASPPASTSETTKDNGSSATAPSCGGQDAAMATARALSALSKPTSRAARRPSEAVPLNRTR